MDTQELRSLLGHIQGIRHACDLDVLLFFYRHSLALLTNEQLVAYLGYDREQVAQSLEGLIEAGLVTRSQNSTHAARLYSLELSGLSGNLLASLLKISTTRQGRYEVLRLLQTGPNNTFNAGARGASPVKVT